MITKGQSIPVKSDAFRRGLDVLYEQFNDISFFVEDEHRENFYFEVLRRLFPEIKLAKIFPLGGKPLVLEEAKNCLRSKRKVFLLDKDFDDLLNKTVSQPNLFYLTKYSIENFLISEESVVNFVIEEKDTLNRSGITRSLELNRTLVDAYKTFFSLTTCHLLVQHYGIGLQNVSRSPDRYLIKVGVRYLLNEIELRKYEGEIATELKLIDNRFTTHGRLSYIKRTLGIKNWKDMECHIPGKYLLRYLQLILKEKFNIKSCPQSSFAIRLAKNSSFENLQSLKTQISDYVSSA